MGLIRATTCMMSYVKARIFRNPNPKNYEEWVTNQFGAKLFNMFFRSYTEKVWGIPCSQIGADWAAQRIKGLSLGEAVRNALLRRKKGSVVTTLIDQFRYPKFGPGQLWENATKKLIDRGWAVRMNTAVVGVRSKETASHRSKSNQRRQEPLIQKNFRRRMCFLPCRCARCFGV